MPELILEYSTGMHSTSITIQELPLKCPVLYFPDFIGRAEANELFKEIVSNFDVTDKRMKLADGGEFLAENACFLFADAELVGFDTIAEVWGKRAPWPDFLADIRDQIAALTGVRFQVARSVYYVDGNEGIDFHRDLPAFGNTDEIASLSLGAERHFVFRDIADKEKCFTLRLASGSLLFMGDGCQALYEHGLPRDARCRAPRLNITFRKFGWD